MKFDTIKASSTTDEEKATRACRCDYCRKDGQHEPMCSVHLEPPEPCDCFRAIEADQ